MTKYKHLTLSDRIDIEKYLGQGFNFSEIGRLLNKSDRTIAFEVKKHKKRIKKNSFNNYKFSPCEKLNHTPFVCNGCDTKISCRKTRYEYYAKDANNDYKELLTNSRVGIDMECDEFNNLNNIINEDIKKGHSFSMIVNNHKNEINKSKRTLYNYLEKGYLDIGNIDLPRKVRYKTRKKKEDEPKLRKTKIREGRTYQDFLKYKEEFFINNGYDASIVEMDTVLGPSKENESCVLTLLFRTSNFLMIFKLEHKNVECVDNAFEFLKTTLGLKLFSKQFQIILTDNGSEFFDPEYIENNGNFPKTKLFYCDPRQSQQKGKIEVTHEYLRRYIPKGTSFNKITQEQLNEICNHINSVPRDKFGGISAFSVQRCFTPDDFFKKLNYKEILGVEIDLTPNLLKSKKDTTNK